MTEDKIIEEIVLLLTIRVRNETDEQIAERREAIQWRFKELINIAAAKGRGQIQ